MIKSLDEFLKLFNGMAWGASEGVSRRISGRIKKKKHDCF